MEDWPLHWRMEGWTVEMVGVRGCCAQWTKGDGEAEAPWRTDGLIVRSSDSMIPQLHWAEGHRMHNTMFWVSISKVPCDHSPKVMVRAVTFKRWGLVNNLTLLRLALEGDCRKSIASSLSVLWAPWGKTLPLLWCMVLPHARNQCSQESRAWSFQNLGSNDTFPLYELMVSLMLQ